MLIPLLFKTFRDHVRGIAGWVSGIVALIAVQLAVYPTVRDTTSRVTDFADAFPEAFKKILPDALSAEAWFRFHGRYANGERITADA